MSGVTNYRCHIVELVSRRYDEWSPKGGVTKGGMAGVFISCAAPHLCVSSRLTRTERRRHDKCGCAVFVKRARRARALGLLRCHPLQIKIRVALGCPRAARSPTRPALALPLTPTSILASLSTALIYQHYPGERNIATDESRPP